MIGRLTGSIVFEEIDGTLVFDVQGVGYEVSTPAGTGGRLRAISPQGPSTLYVHTHVREDIFQLYGFATFEDRLLFRTLLGVSSIGPKTALAIIAALPAAELARAVQRRELGRLTAVPGVGKKTAERLMLELRDKLSGASFPSGPSQAPSAAAAGGGGGSSSAPPARELLFGALTRMGFKAPDVDRAIDEFGDRVGAEPLGDLVREALQRLTKLAERFETAGTCLPSPEAALGLCCTAAARGGWWAYVYVGKASRLAPSRCPPPPSSPQQEARTFVVGALKPCRPPTPSGVYACRRFWQARAEGAEAPPRRPFYAVEAIVMARGARRAGWRPWCERTLGRSTTRVRAFRARYALM